ncbi:MAG: winged helix-turn-helix transcriptional regulator [Thermoplasmata archaeon]
MEKKEYLNFFPVSSDMAADVLGNEATWACLKAIRNNGLEGITAQEISEETGQPLSTIYSAVKDLWRQGIINKKKEKRDVESEPGRPTEGEAEEKRKNKMGRRSYCYYQPCQEISMYEDNPIGTRDDVWGDLVFTRRYMRGIGREVSRAVKDSGLRNELIDFAEEIYNEMKEDPDFKKHLHQKKICPECKKSHQGEEFFKAILLQVAMECVNSAQMDELLSKTGYKEKE